MIEWYWIDNVTSGPMRGVGFGLGLWCLTPLSTECNFCTHSSNCPIRTKNIFDAVFSLAFDECKQKFYDCKARIQSPDW